MESQGQTLNSFSSEQNSGKQGPQEGGPQEGGPQASFTISNNPSQPSTSATYNQQSSTYNNSTSSTYNTHNPQKSVFFDDQTLASLFQANEWSFANQHNTSFTSANNDGDLDSWLLTDLNGLGDAKDSTGAGTAAGPSNPSDFYNQPHHHHHAEYNLVENLQPDTEVTIPKSALSQLLPSLDPDTLQDYLATLSGSAASTAVSGNTTTKGKRKQSASQSRGAKSKKAKSVASGGEEEEEQTEGEEGKGGGGSEDYQTKRKKNTLASQKFRARKKEKDAQMALLIKQQEEQIGQLRDKIKEQEMEIRFFKKLLASKGESGFD